MVEDLGLLLSEMVEPDADPWKPRITPAPGGEPSDLNLPAQELLCAATAMARLHGSRTPIFAAAPRTSSGEVEKMRERAARLAEAIPVQADMVLALAERLADRLEAAQPEVLLPDTGASNRRRCCCGLGRPS